MTTKETEKKRIHNKFVLTKKVPNRFSKKVGPVICEATDQVFTACGSSVKVYSLKTSM